MSYKEDNFNWYQSIHPILFGWALGKFYSVQMGNTKEVGSINRPPVLDVTNYNYWKVEVIAFLKSMDNKKWKAIINKRSKTPFDYLLRWNINLKARS